MKEYANALKPLIELLIRNKVEPTRFVNDLKTVIEGMEQVNSIEHFLIELEDACYLLEEWIEDGLPIEDSLMLLEWKQTIL